MKKPSFFRIVFTDYWCYLLFLLTVGCTICFFFLFTIPVALLTGYFLAKRIRLIRNVFNNGVAVTGLITKKRFQRGEWLLRYCYSYNGVDYECGNYIVRFWVKLARGDRSEVYLNPNKPTEAFLSQFYLGK
ncbi:hypothetical protein JMG10_40100 [Nostoc ellipsosporum NOK]|nr:hypothetical protein [Nostoc ellipsosporum NOK]